MKVYCRFERHFRIIAHYCPWSGSNKQIKTWAILSCCFPPLSAQWAAVRVQPLCKYLTVTAEPNSANICCSPSHKQAQQHSLALFWILSSVFIVTPQSYLDFFMNINWQKNCLSREDVYSLIYKILLWPTSWIQQNISQKSWPLHCNLTVEQSEQDVLQTVSPVKPMQYSDNQWLDMAVLFVRQEQLVWSTHNKQTRWIDEE